MTRDLNEHGEEAVTDSKGRTVILTWCTCEEPDYRHDDEGCCECSCEWFE